MVGAITAVAATITVGIGATTLAGGIIAIGGDSYPRAKRCCGSSRPLFFLLDRAIKGFRCLVVIADKPGIASSARFCHRCWLSPVSAALCRAPASKRLLLDGRATA